jgi:hypothetical protein
MYICVYTHMYICIIHHSAVFSLNLVQNLSWLAKQFVICIMGFYALPKGVHTKMDTIWSRFFL